MILLHQHHNIFNTRYVQYATVIVIYIRFCLIIVPLRYHISWLLLSTWSWMVSKSCFKDWWYTYKSSFHSAISLIQSLDSLLQRGHFFYQGICMCMNLLNRWLCKMCMQEKKTIKTQNVALQLSNMAATSDWFVNVSAIFSGVSWLIFPSQRISLNLHQRSRPLRPFLLGVPSGITSKCRKKTVSSTDNVKLTCSQVRNTSYRTRVCDREELGIKMMQIYLTRLVLGYAYTQLTHQYFKPLYFRCFFDSLNIFNS